MKGVYFAREFNEDHFLGILLNLSRLLRKVGLSRTVYFIG